MFKELNDKIQYAELERGILKFWDDNNVFEKSITTREGKTGFTFYEGPPTANGRPGIHHVMARALKDLVCRYKTMRGYQVHRKAGWDTHGLPVEIEVEKMLGFKSKDDIVHYGVAKFNEECRKSVWKYKTEWEEMTRQMGYWVDMKDPYITFENNFIESVWWSLQQYFEKDMIYKGYKVQPYCPRCETTLSSHEVSLGYKDITDESIYVKFKLANEKDTYFLVWTTTPWTLLSNIALAVHPDFTYVKVQHNGEYLILAKDRLEALDGEKFIIEEMRGNELANRPYYPLYRDDASAPEVVNETYGYLRFRLVQEVAGCSELYLWDDQFRNEDFVVVSIRGVNKLMAETLAVRLGVANEITTSADKLSLSLSDVLQTGSQVLWDDLPGKTEVDNFEAPETHYVTTARFVTTSDGSGIVHLAPAYGEDDHQVSLRFRLPTIHTVDKSGRFNSEIRNFGGMFVFEASNLIAKDLDARKLLYKKRSIHHSYPHCWRCSTKLLYYARDSWFIATTKYAQRMVAINKTINWHPPEVGSGRFGNWLEDNKDWALSRDRFWGTPLPIWVCQECGGKKCVGSIAELRKGNNVTDPIDLHKPYVDGITFTCSCGGEMRRTPELIDVWYDSGAMQFAQWHYPFENKEIFDARHPADYICEGIDQTRGWFYSLHSISTFLFNRPAYKNLIVNELILDKEGQKMSKSKGNTVNPFDILNKYGADTTRWYLVTTSPPWRPTLFDEEGLIEVQRKFFGTLVNTYSFFSMYANIDSFDPVAVVIPHEQRPEMDRWIISSLNSLVKEFLAAMDGYDVTRAARAVSSFTIDQLSNWYVRRNRRRFWSKLDDDNTSTSTTDKIAAYQTLQECLLTIAKLMAPFAPFFAEELYQNLTRATDGSSVHLADMPVPVETLIDQLLESRMTKAQRMVSLVRAIRNKAGINIRQPLNRILVPVRDEAEGKMWQSIAPIILDETNVKVLDPAVQEDSIKYSIKANFKALGQKHGKLTQRIANAIHSFSDREIRELDYEGQIDLSVDGTTFVIKHDEVFITPIEITGWAMERDRDITVALDTTLSKELIDEGIAREFVSRIQNYRRESDFEIMDRINMQYNSSDAILQALKLHASYIMNETLAIKFEPTVAPKGDDTAEFEINGINCLVGITKTKA